MAKTATPRYERPFKNEHRILLKQVCTLEDTFMVQPSHQKVCWWAEHGVRGLKLEAHREGGQIWTSVEAVHRFIERGNNRAR